MNHELKEALLMVEYLRAALTLALNEDGGTEAADIKNAKRIRKEAAALLRKHGIVDDLMATSRV